MYISFVVPVFNEEDNVEALHAEILAVARGLKKPFEIIFVDDGSTDGTYRKLGSLSPIKTIRLRKNFGQTAALDAGIKAAAGELLATLDGDGQNNPADVPPMLLKLEADSLDVVCGWRTVRKDTLDKRIISAGAKWLRGWLVRDGVHDSGCTLRVYRKECFAGVYLRGEMHRFIPAILGWRGFRIGEMPVDHRQRKYGTSKYTFKRTLKGLLDMMSIWFFQKFSSRPLHLLGAIGLLLFVGGLVIGTWMVLIKIVWGQSLANLIWPLAAVFLMLSGMQMFVSGLIMDVIITSNDKLDYSIREKH